MASRSLRILRAALTMMLPTVALAAPAPHDTSYNVTGCTTCHKIHNAPGASLTNVAGNANLCNSCHLARKTPENRALLPYGDGDQATPGTSGVHHRWGGLVVNPTYGSKLPTDPTLLKARSDGTYYYLPGGSVGCSGDACGDIQCSTCHNEHNAGVGFAPAHTSIPVATWVLPTGNDITPLDVGTGTLRLNTPGANVAARGYRLQITTGGAAGAARFKLSFDGGTTWRGWDGLAWVTWTALPDNSRLTGTAVQLADVNTVIDFGDGTFNVGDVFVFYVSYPFLRVTNVDSALCQDCHRERVQSAACVSGESGATDGAGQPCVADGVRVFSHPSGPAAPQAAVLDADGSTNDSNPANDMHLGSDGTVRCMTCHRVHNAYSNSRATLP